MNLQSNDFVLLGLEQQFAQDLAQVDGRWKALQRQVHPDQFAAQGAAAQRVAMQWSARINEAHQRIKDPLKRAAYLCELAGSPVDAHVNTAMPGAFLMQQMEWREALDSAVESVELEALLAEVQGARKAALQQCQDLLDRVHDYPGAVGVVRSLMFIEKFARDLDQRLEAIDN